MAKTVAVLGARNLGGAIIDHFLKLGWNAAGVARNDDTLERVRQRGAVAIGADAADMSSLTAALRTARSELGSLDAVVNSVSLAVDATIESPKTAAFTRDTPRDALGEMTQIAEAVSFLVHQESRALTHELVVTPAGERWVP